MCSDSKRRGNCPACAHRRYGEASCFFPQDALVAVSARWLYVDADGFFATWEVAVEPRLLGSPMAARCLDHHIAGLPKGLCVLADWSTHCGVGLYVQAQELVDQAVWCHTFARVCVDVRVGVGDDRFVDRKVGLYSWILQLGRARVPMLAVCAWR